MEVKIKKTKISRLNYVKLILKKVSFSPFLFKKELQKGIEYCSDAQIALLKRWCLKHFASIYAQIIIQVFRGFEPQLIKSSN